MSEDEEMKLAIEMSTKSNHLDLDAWQNEISKKNKLLFTFSLQMTQ
jgi:hypothetical protein